ncbi:MAG: 16S rRNA (uracil(1498)-N(3))-methyltransferase, partial [Acidobacteria bacterium]|nr:16S rRNA (uracil(1498)-N(3))-methyltransferase [Acidobacteriota bacterium]
QHLRSVLRLKAGDEVFVFDGEGREFACVVADDGRGGATELTVRERVASQRPESSLELMLAVALLKGEKFDLVVQKATELGATRIMPVATKRTDVRLRDAAQRLARWQRLALEAAKQSGRARVPQVSAPVAFDSLLGSEPGAAQTAPRLMFTERLGRSLVGTMKEWTEPPGKMIALVGPEGGWDDEEIEQARDAGWQLVTLGGRTLRAETAAITVACLLQHLCGDLR